jgi:hypothetical protein
MIRARFVASLGFVLCCSPILASSLAQVWKGTLVLPVYAEGLPDQNSPFDQFGRPANYPYSLRENLTDNPLERSLRAIHPESMHLKRSVLPDLGGDLYTCTDSLSGQSMFYANLNINKARVGSRGARAAFGDEFNFPVSHNWVSLSPGDLNYASHADGSASVTVGNIDRVYGVEWTVEMTLRPGSSVLEQRVILANRSDVRHRLNWWNNRGVQAWEDSRICYPTHFTAAPGFADINSWPLNSKGADYSVIRNQQDGPVSRVIYRSRKPFLGIWNPHTNAGIVHYADHGTLPRKKVWSWGDDAAGREWRRVLSDNDSTYVEVREGPFRDHETYAYLEPRTGMQLSNYRMPIGGIRRVARANLDGILNLDRNGKTLRAALNVNHKIAGASIRILDVASPLVLKRADLSPDKMWMTTISIQALSWKYSFELSDASGQVLLSQAEGKYDVTPNSEVSPGPLEPNDFRTTEEQAAMLHVLHHDARATAFVVQALTRSPKGKFLRKQADRPDIEHLASDPDRVLGIAPQYMRLVTSAQALEVLTRDYPSVAPDEMEPGATLPQQHAIVLYYKAYCRQKLGQPAHAEYDAAALAAPLNVFPHNFNDVGVFRFAIRVNAEDANTHYLPGAEDLFSGLCLARTGDAHGTQQPPRKSAFPTLLSTVR